MHMWDPVSRVKIGGKWEQLHDCYFPQLPPRYVPWELSSEETISWVFFEKLPLTGMGMGCFSEVFWEVNNFLDIVYQKLISYDFCTSFVFHKWRRPVGGSRWKLPELTSVRRFLACVKDTTNRSPLTVDIEEKVVQSHRDIRSTSTP